MPKRVAVTSLNASTLDILNVIRQNASYDYQQNVPVANSVTDIPKVGEVIYGTPAFANQFINALVNRIALVRMNSATFNNPYSGLKKGYLEFGETVEEIFVQIAKVVEYSAEKGAAREFKRTFPDVRSAFHVMNWRVMYPVTIQDQDLKMAFTSASGVQSLVAKIVDSVYTAAEYDEFLLFKYLLIKGISHGKFYPIGIGDGTDLRDAAIQYRGTSNLLPFMKDQFNEAHVLTTTPKERQFIFMDTYYNAEYDVNLLAAAFNMDKAEFMGKLHLIDDFTSFDNTRFEVIRENSDGIEPVTDEELELMKGVKAVLIDSDWFQVYDNNARFTEDYVAAGLYWNYFYHQWKTVSNSPFSNAIVFCTDGAYQVLPTSITVKVHSVDQSDEGTAMALEVLDPDNQITNMSVLFVQTEAATTLGIAVENYGGIFWQKDAKDAYTVTCTINGTNYVGSSVTPDTAVGTEITLSKQ